MTSLSSWLDASQSPFDLLVGDTGQFPRDTILVDQAFLDREFERAFPDRFGVFPLEAADLVVQRVALRFAQRLAKAEAARLGVSANGLRHAWFHPIYAELTTLAPIRHLARKLYRANRDNVFAIELPKTSFAAVNYWRLNELEPIYLAYELRRLGAKTCLWIGELKNPVLRFGLSGAWRRKWTSQFRRDHSFSNVLCKRHIRRDDFAAQRSGATHRLLPGPLALLRSRRIGDARHHLTLNLQRGPTLDGMPVFSAPVDTPELLAAFADLMAPPTTFFHEWLRKALRGKDVKTAHIADHASLEGGLLAAVVLAKGGRVHLWPHSANAVDVNVHAPEDVAKVTLAARSTAAIWAESLGAGKVTVDIRTVLRDLPKAPPFEEGAPIHVILFGGAHALQRVPFFSLETHKASWRTALAGLQAADVKLTIKHKSQWETRDWIRQLAQDGSTLQFTRTHANDLSLPNMVFMSVSLTSTALFEGIARGIPGIVVRDVPVIETPYYDPDYIPRIPSDAVGEYLASLNSKDAWDALRERQLDWFERETAG